MAKLFSNDQIGITNMSYIKVKKNVIVEAVDISSMAEMTEEEYEAYIRGHLLFVDHHDVLRSAPAEYPLAVTKRQFQSLLNYLKELEPKVGLN
jgi:hypothetical protein